MIEGMELVKQCPCFREFEGEQLCVNDNYVRKMTTIDVDTELIGSKHVSEEFINSVSVLHTWARTGYTTACRSNRTSRFEDNWSPRKRCNVHWISCPLRMCNSRQSFVESVCIISSQH